MRNKKNKNRSRHYRKAFSLVEAITALAILALVCSSVMVVINRCLGSVTDSVVRMQALEVARDNMEQLLASASVKEGTEYGESDKYPDIKWQTVIETFYEPITSRMWIRGICSADYGDTTGEPQTIELTHWLTDLTKEQLLQIMQQEEEEKERMANQIIGTIEEAAEYAGVEVDTIEQWIDDGMLQTDDGSFVKNNLDLFKQSEGKPSADAIRQQVQSEEEIRELVKELSVPDQPEPADYEEWKKQIDPTTGLTNEELEKMDFMELFKLLLEKRKR